MLKILIFLICLYSCIAKAASLPPVEGKTCMAVSAQHYATEVGFDILKKGGNAIDAAVAMGYALAVVHPCCGNIGGGGFMLIRFSNGETTFLNFREKAPKSIKPELFLDKNGNVISEYLSAGHISGGLKRPYLAVGVPGTVKGLNVALSEYGTMSLQQVIAPAIELAKNGYQLLPGDVDILKNGEKNFQSQANVAAIFLKNNRIYQPGECLIQKNLAATLEEIAKYGSAGFYQGKIATEIVKANQENGGLITKEDLQTYSVEESKPITCNYHGYQIITTPLPGSGVTICQSLKILEPYPLSQLGFHAAQSTHYILEAMRFSYADRNYYLGDPNFVPNFTAYLLSDKHIENIRKQIKPNQATNSNAITFLSIPKECANTTAYVVVDKKGNAVSVTYTLNDYFGAKVIPGNTGFFLNNEMADFTIKPGVANSYGLIQGKSNIIVGAKRPLSSMSPTIIAKNNKLFMVVGTPGGSTIPSQLINVILNVIDYGMNIQEAVNAPRYHMQWLPDFVYMEPFTFSMDTQKILEKMGYKFQLGSPYGTLYWGAVTGIIFNETSQKLYGAIDSRRPVGAAIGE